MQNLSSWEIKPKNISGLIQTHDRCDISAVLYQPSYQAICELAMLGVTT